MMSSMGLEKEGMKSKNKVDLYYLEGLNESRTRQESTKSHLQGIFLQPLLPLTTALLSLP